MFEDSTGRFQTLSAEFGRVWSLFESAGHSTRGLSQSDRVFFLVYMADNEIHSNGIYALWFNNLGLLDTPEVPNAFREIGAPSSAQVIERFVWCSSRMPAFRNVTLRVWQMRICALFWPGDERLDSDYYQTGEDIDALLISHLNGSSARAAVRDP